MKTTALTVALCGALCGVAACGPKEAPPAPKAAEAPINPLEITAGEQLRGRVKTGAATWTDVALSQSVAARIDVDETRVARIGSPVMGRIIELMALEGQQVKRGELLALINSTGLSDAQLVFLKAVSQLQVAQRAVERAQMLVKADVIGTAELQKREADLAQATAELDVARDELELLGMPREAIDKVEATRTINSVARIVASMSGTVLARNLTVGQVVQPTDTAFEVADLSSLWLQADVPEQNAGGLRIGSRVAAAVAALPGVTIDGALSYVAATVNPETRTVRVRMQLPNPDGRFKPSMLATVTLSNQPTRQLVVPTSAVVREANDEFVFVQAAPNRYVMRPVKLGAEVGGVRVVTEGVRDDETIVVDGAFHLNNERRRLLLRGSEEA